MVYECIISECGDIKKLFKFKDGDIIWFVDMIIIIFFEFFFVLYKIVLYFENGEIEFYGFLKEIEE